MRQHNEIRHCCNSVLLKHQTCLLPSRRPISPATKQNKKEAFPMYCQAGKVVAFVGFGAFHDGGACTGSRQSFCICSVLQVDAAAAKLGLQSTCSRQPIRQFRKQTRSATCGTRRRRLLAELTSIPRLQTEKTSTAAGDAFNENPGHAARVSGLLRL